MSKTQPIRAIIVESSGLVILALGLYLPFLAIQYDINGIVEANALESGQLLYKNHVLYRPIGLLFYRTLQVLGYQGNSLLVLQTINAVCGAIGIGLAYAVFRSATRGRPAALMGALFLATSLTYWLFSTDVAYITPAALFVLAATVLILYADSTKGFVAAGLFLSLSVLTWQASVVALPPLIALLFWRKPFPVYRNAAFFCLTLAAVTIPFYVLLAVASGGFMGPREFWAWLTNHGDAGAGLPLWGVWGAERMQPALSSALRSVVPSMLAISPVKIRPSIQFGRLVVDVALIALTILIVLAALKARLKSLWFLFGYLVFIPFIVWWDPFEPKWFFIPNICFAGFLSCGLEYWLQRRRVGIAVILCVLTIAAANFVTIIRPRHGKLGPDRSMAQCVAEHMQPQDAFIAAEWGWPDYLGYLHQRTEINLINETAGAGSKEKMLEKVKGVIGSTNDAGGSVYMLEPHAFSQSHLEWLQAATGLTLDDLTGFGGSHSVTCEGKPILHLPSAR